MQLSKRLSAVALQVTRGNRLVDVGTDHGYVPIFLVQKNHVPKAIAMDINQGPLNRAKDNIIANNLQNYIETRLSDGIKALNPSEGDSLVIAGMGGNLVIKILDESKEKISGFKEIILQPQSEIIAVREYLLKHNFNIIFENFLEEDGKYYVIMKVVHGKMNDLSKIELKYGKLLLENKNPVLHEYLLKEKEQLSKIKVLLQEKNTLVTNARLKEIEANITDTVSALGYYN